LAALSLLDVDPAVQRGPQLLVEGAAVARAAFVQQAEQRRECHLYADVLASHRTESQLGRRHENALL
jgi:hypothetical protein